MITELIRISFKYVFIIFGFGLLILLAGLSMKVSSAPVPTMNAFVLYDKECNGHVIIPFRHVARFIYRPNGDSEISVIDNFGFGNGRTNIEKARAKSLYIQFKNWASKQP